MTGRLHRVYYVNEVLGPYGRKEYSVKKVGDPNAMLKVCGHGEEARANADMIAAALNYYRRLS